MRKRKLLSCTALTKLEAKEMAGIPLAAAMRQMSIDMSRPAVVKLLAHMKKSDDYQLDEEYKLIITLSLFPEWLDKQIEHAQEQPDNWKYVGYFPSKGEWVQC